MLDHGAGTVRKPTTDDYVAYAKVADKLPTRLTVALEKPYAIGADKLHCAASIGLALYPKNANTLTGLLREADQAMYRAKNRRKGSIVFEQVGS